MGKKGVKCKIYKKVYGEIYYKRVNTQKLNKYKNHTLFHSYGVFFKLFFIYKTSSCGEGEGL